MDNMILSLLGGILYLSIGILLFIGNLFLFEWWTPFDVRNNIIKVQNKALGLVIRGQIIAQGIMIASVIFFTGYTPDHEFLKMSVFLPSIGATLGFGIIGMLFLQGILSVILKNSSLEKEILIDHNESLGMIIEALLIATAMLISIAFYSY